MVHDVREKPVEDLKGSINKARLLRVDESKQFIEQTLPDALRFILVLDHSSLNFDSNIANFMCELFVDGLCCFESFDDLLL